MNDKEIETLRKWSQEELGENFDLLDFEHSIDRSINLSEAWTELRKKFELIIPAKEDIKQMKSDEIKYQVEQTKSVNNFNDENCEKADKLKKIFNNTRVVGLAGAKSTGKTNNLCALIKEFRDVNKTTKIYIYGVNEQTIKWLKQLQDVYEISSLDQLSDKENSLIVIEEFQKLRLNDRRYKDLLNLFVDFIYHNNNWLIFSSPSLREYNSVIGSKIERWCLKSLRMSDLIHGSQLKMAVISYCGRFKALNDIKVPNDTLLIINEDYEQLVKLPYIKEVDSKKDKINIFEIVKQNVGENVNEK